MLVDGDSERRCSTAPIPPGPASDFWQGSFRLPESGEYSVLVDPLGYPANFTVTVTEAP